MSISDRKKRDKEALKKKILNGAAEIVMKLGHENLKIRDLAKKIEYSPRTIYLYYQDKAALLEAVIEKGFERTALQIKKIPKTDSIPPEKILKVMIENHVKTAFFNPNYYRAVVNLAMDRNFKPGPHQKTVNNKVCELLRLYYSDSNKGISEIEIIAGIIINSLRGISMNLINRDEKMEQTEINNSLEIFNKIVFEGLKGDLNEK